jgi:glycosyltransferase involved in cell wall biosynthesis
MQMRILFDGPYSKSTKSGIAKYFERLSLELTKKHSVFFSRRSFSDNSSEINLPLPFHFRPHRLSFFIERLCFQYFTRKPFQIIHPIEYELSPAGEYCHRRNSKLVITVHDLIHEKFGAPGKLYEKESRSSFYAKANGFIFASNSTRNDFGEFYPELADHTPGALIWHGNNFENTNLIDTKKKKQVLFVGARDGYKNFKGAVESFRLVASDLIDLRLVVAGPPAQPSELSLIHDLHQRVDWVTYPEENELRKIYAESVALMYVSKYEGFGMPIVEAMSQGCIPVAINHSSLPEIMGDAGILLESSDPHEIGRAISMCCKDSAFSEMKVRLGEARSKIFNWEKCAKEVLSFYKEL